MKKKNVLVYRVGQLGDTLVALPAIEAIVKRHQGCHLVLLTDRHSTVKGYVSSWDVLGPTGWFNEVIFYESRDLTLLERVKSILSLLMQLRSYRFSHIYNLAMRTTDQTVRRDRFFFESLVNGQSYLGMAAVAYPPPRELSGHLPRMKPEWQRLLDVVGTDDAEDFRLAVPLQAQKEVIRIRPELEQIGSQRIIALGPGSKMSAKRWSKDRFNELGQRLLLFDNNLRIVIVGGAEDSSIGDYLCSALGNNAVNLAGRLSIYGSAALLKCCSLYIGNDTGTMHLAATVGLSCVSIFCARDYPGLWEPYGKGHVILRQEIGCSGCMLESCLDRGNDCLEAISVEEVFEAVRKRLIN